MREHPVLSEREWELVLELLERERFQLPIEIHHTRTRTMRDELRARLSIIEDLVLRVSHALGTNQLISSI